MPFLDAESIVSSTFVRRVELHESLPSTNTRATELAATPDLVPPVLVVARSQTAGRGRGTNAWWSGDGALTFSLILDTAEWHIAPRDWPRLSLATAVAVCDAIVEDTPADALAIKWPNDVLVDGAKICGILIESPGNAGSGQPRLIVGVGINVNNSRRDAPPEIQASSVALCDLAGQSCDIQRVLIRFLQSFERRTQQLADRDPALVEAWQNRSWLTDRWVSVASGHQTIEGTCRGIDDEGALLVERRSHLERLFSGTVRAIAT